MLITNLIAKFRSSAERLILLDYDGTLVNFAPTPDGATPTQRLLKVLSRLCATPGVTPVIITGRESANIDALVGHLPINIVAEHGAMIKINNKWQKEIDSDDKWKQVVMEILEKQAALNPGSIIEKKQYAVTWHYRQMEEKAGAAAAKKLLAEIQPLLEPLGLKVLEGNKVIEIISGNTNKGDAAKKLLNFKEFDFVLAIGDDKTDEDMFKALRDVKNCYTIKVGPGPTYAKQQLVNVPEVLLFLEQI
jgi:trehalose 6-phosphate synthase/phosphatase